MIRTLGFDELGGKTGEELGRACKPHGFFLN